MNKSQHNRLSLLKEKLSSFDPQKRADQAQIIKLLIDKDVIGPNNKSLGWVEDVYFDSRTSSLIYFTVAYKSFFFSRTIRRYLCAFDIVDEINDTTVTITLTLKELRLQGHQSLEQIDKNQGHELVSVRSMVPAKVRELNQDEDH